MIIKIDKKSNFALVGHGYHICYFYEKYFLKFRKNPIIITHEKKKHLRDIKSFKDSNVYKNIFKLKKAKIFAIQDINSEKGFEILRKNNIKYIFSFSSRFIFKEKILNLFHNKIFNIHPSILPSERGAGTFTNRILNQKYFACATIHLVNSGIDSGNILFTSKKVRLNRNSLPIDFIKNTNKCYKILIDRFLNSIFGEKKILLQKQNHKNKTYYSRYNTDLNGLIDWTSSGKSIEIFIKAFSYPYPGAKTKVFLGKKIYNASILKSKFFKNNSKTHSYMFGKIFYQDKKTIKINVRDGYLKVNLKDIKFNFKKKDKLRLEGKTFFNEFKDMILLKQIPIF